MLNDKKEETNKSVVINMLKDGETYEKMRYTGVTEEFIRKIEKEMI